MILPYIFVHLRINPPLEWGLLRAYVRYNLIRLAYLRDNTIDTYQSMVLLSRNAMTIIKRAAPRSCMTQRRVGDET